VAVLYAGEEIGMVDADPADLPHPPFDRAGRDACRTPMQWDASAGGGFTSGTPWLPLVDHASRNVADQSADPASLLSLYRRLIGMRAESAALARGTHRSIFGVAPGVLAWLREADGERVLVLINTADAERACDLRRVQPTGAEVLVATSERVGRVALEVLGLGASEGLALALDPE
jgi:alpha-glucosidase